MANKDAPHGYKIWGDLLRARTYAVITAPTINVMVDDLVGAGSTGVLSGKLGNVMAIEDGAIIPATPGDAERIRGAVQACFDEKMDPISYIAAGRVGDGTVAGYVLVADHPDQQFESQLDAAGAVADLDLHYEITSPTLSEGNTSTGLSYQEIDVTGAAVTNTLPIILLGQAYPEEDVITAAGCRFICCINSACHYYAAPTGI